MQVCSPMDWPASVRPAKYSRLIVHRSQTSLGYQRRGWGWRYTVEQAIGFQHPVNHFSYISGRNTIHLIITSHFHSSRHFAVFGQVLEKMK